MQKPIVVEMFADNGEHSHWELIDSSTGETLWEQPELMPNDGKPIVSGNKTVRESITEIMYKNSSDDSECLRIKFENIEKVINEIVMCVG